MLILSSCKTKQTVLESPKVDSSALLAAAKPEVDTEYYAVVEKPAIFQNGDINTFVSFLKKNTKYPYNALKRQQHGLVAIQFGVDCYGKVKIISTLKSSGYPLLDKEVIRAISSSPTWIPAQNQGVKVGQLFLLQFTFKFKTRSIEIK